MKIIDQLIIFFPLHCSPYPPSFLFLRTNRGIRIQHTHTLHTHATTIVRDYFYFVYVSFTFLRRRKILPLLLFGVLGESSARSKGLL